MICDSRNFFLSTSILSLIKLNDDDDIFIHTVDMYYKEKCKKRNKGMKKEQPFNVFASHNGV